MIFFVSILEIILKSMVGTALVNDAIESIQQIGLGQLSVNTQEKNTSSRRLYEKLGFRTTGKEFPVFEIQL